ncbi:MAG: chemotaxis protein CheA [Deltaproteobacteria bacterium]|nr:chemotaxis protein CheA [Deltaproteobacteria bacterium]
MGNEKYRDLFLGETRAHLDDALKALAAGGGGDALRVDDLFRHFHSIKGMAASMGLGAIASLAHAVEDILSDARRWGLKPEWSFLVQETADRISAMVDMYEAGGAPEDDAALEARLKAACSARAEAGARGATPATAPDAAPGASAGSTALVVRVDIDAASKMPATRAFMVLKKLHSLGIACASEPSEAELRAGGTRPSSLVVRLAPGARREDAVEAINGVPEVAVASVESHEMTGPAAAARRSKLPARVSPEILDRLQEQAGELFIIHRELASAPPAREDLRLREAVGALHRAVRDLHETVTCARLVPLDLVTARIPLRVRELALKLGKDIEAEVRGGDVGLDRSHVEKLEAPLQHLVRNAVDHGIETPHERILAGKPPRGTIAVTAARGGRGVKIEIRDDGRGLDHERIREAAVARGIVGPDRALTLGQQDLYDLICLPGFSTAREVSAISGRGVGMDVVKQAVSDMGGEMSITSTPGLGTTFTLDLPVSMVQLHAMIVGASGGEYAVPAANIAEVVELSRGEMLVEGGRPFIRWRGVAIPVRSLSEILSVQAAPPEAVFRFLVIEFKGKHLGLRVDRVDAEAEIVMRPLGVPLNLVSGFAGYSILGGGHPVLILDPIKLAGATAFA